MKTIIQKAIKYFDGYGSPYDELVIEALEKQIPYTLTDISTTYTGEKIGTCKCGNYAVLEHEKYCTECGQKVSWEAEDD